MAYWAHSDSAGLPPDDPASHWQTLADHLEKTAVIASRLAANARPGDDSFKRAAELCGYLHDLGKYSDCFQRMIVTGRGRCKHAAHGAVVAYEIGNPSAAF